jgi:folate-binding protein YgfZ
MSRVNYCLRQDLGIVRVTGADARAFLHAQTTQEINDLAPFQTRLAAWLSPKGRVRALIDVVPCGDGFWLITEADNVSWLAEQLSFFVLRSAVELAVADSAIYTICGDIGEWLSGAGAHLHPSAVIEHNDAHWLSAGPSSVTVVGKPTSLAAILAGLPSAEIDTAVLTQIALGRPSVTAALRERYIPQMLNLDSLGAISFTKGCYPGQEIVARTQNLGEVKRRLRRFRVGSGERPEPGDAIVDAETKAVGEINCVAATDEAYELLAVVQLDAAEGVLLLASDGRKLESLALPYDG